MKRYSLVMLCVLCLVVPVLPNAPVASYAIDYVDIVVACPAQEEWTGNYGTVGSTQSVQGTGPTSYRLNRGNVTFWVISAVFQKHTAGSWNLTVSVVTGSTVHQRASTTAEFGSASVSWTYICTDAGTLPTGIPGFPLVAVLVGLICALTAGFTIRHRNR